MLLVDLHMTAAGHAAVSKAIVLRLATEGGARVAAITVVVAVVVIVVVTVVVVIVVAMIIAFVGGDRRGRQPDHDSSSNGVIFV